MLEYINIVGFKRFAKQELEFSKLSVLAGVNGGGKTTVIHSLLLARALARTGAAAVDLSSAAGLDLGEAADLVNSDSEPFIHIDVREDGAHSSGSFAVTNDRTLRLSPSLVNWISQSVFSKGQREFYYICADRHGPRDSFAAVALDPSDMNVGIRGEATAQVLAQCGESPVINSLVHESTAALNARTILRTQSELWLSEIARPTQIDARWIEGSNTAVIRFKDPRSVDWMRPINVGFGLSVALPIIVGALSMREGGLLIVENPEAHLHPQGQSRIGRFLARVAAAGIQVIIETHSDHVLNGIRCAIAVDRTIEHDKVFVHFFDHSRAPELIRMTRYGELTKWPELFFDQSDRDLENLVRSRKRP